MSHLQVAMKLLLAIGGSTGAAVNIPRPVPNLTCKVTGALRVSVPKLRVEQQSDRTVYRFFEGHLFLLPTDRPEYDYGAVKEVSLARFDVGYKTVVFDDAKFSTATVTHSDQFEVRVIRLRCK